MAEAAIDPSRTQNDMAWRGGTHGRLALRLRPPVNAEGRDRIAFDIKAALAAIENIIRRKMD